MVNYQQGKIYKITTPHSSEIYVGSTNYKLLCQRMAKHNEGFKCYQKGKKARYLTSYELLKLGDCEILLLETYPCNGKDELEAREGYWLQKLRDEGLVCVNKMTPGATLACRGRKGYAKIFYQGYYQDNKEDIKEYQAKYRQDNKEVLKGYHAKRYQDNKEVRKEKDAKYRQDNKEYLINFRYWCRANPIGILGRAYFHELNKHNEN